MKSIDLLRPKSSFEEKYDYSDQLQSTNLSSEQHDCPSQLEFIDLFKEAHDCPDQLEPVKKLSEQLNLNQSLTDVITPMIKSDDMGTMNFPAKLLFPGLIHMYYRYNQIIDEFASKFSKIITDMVSSKSFIKELSDGIGRPMPNETEDEFVARGLKLAKQILSRKLSE